MTLRASGQSERGWLRCSARSASQPMSPCWPAARKAASRARASGRGGVGEADRVEAERRARARMAGRDRSASGASAPIPSRSQPVPLRVVSAQHDDAVAGLHHHLQGPAVGGTCCGALDRDDQERRLGRTLDLRDGQPGQGAALLGDDHLKLQPEPPQLLLGAARTAQRLGAAGEQDHLGDPLGADMRRQHHAVGAGLQQLALGRRRLAAGDDREVRLRLRALRVMNTLAASSGSTVASTRARVDAGARQRRLLGRVGAQAEIAGGLRLGAARLLALQHDKIGARRRAARAPACCRSGRSRRRSRGRRSFSISTVHAPRRPGLAANCAAVKNCTSAPVRKIMPVQPKHDQADGDRPQGGRVDRPHLVIADGIDGEHRHVERVAEAPARSRIADDCQRHHGGDEHRPAGQIADRRAERAGQQPHRRRQARARRSRGPSMSGSSAVSSRVRAGTRRRDRRR